MKNYCYSRMHMYHTIHHVLCWFILIIVKVFGRECTTLRFIMVVYLDSWAFVFKGFNEFWNISNLPKYLVKTFVYWSTTYNFFEENKCWNIKWQWVISAVKVLYLIIGWKSKFSKPWDIRTFLFFKIKILHGIIFIFLKKKENIVPIK